MPVVTVEKPLKDKLGDDGVESLIHLLNATNREHKEDVLQFVEEKFERRLTEEISKLNERIISEAGKINERMTEEIGNVNERMTEEIGNVNERMTEEIGNVNERMTSEISKVNVSMADMEKRLVKWMFIFWVGQIGVIMGLLFAFFR